MSAPSAPPPVRTWRIQLRDNAVALASILIATSTLVYSAWRHEITEDQRTVRQAGFEILRNLGELQTIADHAHFTGDSLQGSPVSGWGRVLAIRDLSNLLPPPARQHSEALFATWQANWSALATEQRSNERITAAINACRHHTVEIIANLD